LKLRRITIRRMPGIDDPFTVHDLGDGLNLIVGPNGSGKSTFCRAVRAALWPSSDGVDSIAVEAEWQDGPHRWLVRRERDRVSWQRDGIDTVPPGLPDEASARCFTLGFRDLLSDEHPTDDAVAREIRRQMSGGFDVQRVLDDEFASRARHGWIQETALRDRRRAVDRIKGEQRGIAEKEDRLRELERELAAAREAAARLESLGTAGELQRANDESQAVERELARFPDGMDRLQGNEQQRLDEMDDELARLRERLGTCEREVDRGREQAEAQRLPEGPIDDAVIQAEAAKARTLQQHEGEIANARKEIAAAAARRNEAIKALDPEVTGMTQPVINRDDLQEVESFLERAGKLRREREQFDAERLRLSRAKPSTPSRTLDQGIDSLRSWLATQAAADASARPRWLPALAFILIAAGPPVGAWLDLTAGWVLGALGLFALLFFFYLRLGGARAGAAAIRRRYEELDLDKPATWEPQAVRDLLRMLEQLWAEAVDRERQIEKIEELDRQGQLLDRRGEELDGERRALRERLGLDPGRGDLDMAQTVRKLSDWQASEADYRAAMAVLEEAEQSHARLLAGIRAFLVARGHAEPRDAEEALAGIEGLRERSGKLIRASEKLVLATSECEAIAESVARVETRRARIFEEAGLQPGEERELLERLGHRQRYLELTRRAHEHRVRVDDCRAKLVSHPELIELDAEAIERQIREAGEQAEHESKLKDVRADIRAAVRLAREGDALERGLADAARAEGELEVCREVALSKAAGRFLLEGVRARYDEQSRPEVLTRAAELFSRFTHHRYELHVDWSSDPPAFRAVETETRLGKALAELSDATRVQLLLAARLAFAGHAGRELKLPLFLDEVLTTSDPERFLAIARSLVVLIREEDRQIFYLTANPSDVTQWKRVLRAAGLEPVRATDLAELRGLAAGVRTETELEVPPLPEVPPPAGMDAERYGALLKVPRVDLNRPPTALHLFHLLRDRLDLLQILLKERLQTVGQWRDFASKRNAADLIGEERAQRISALADLAQAFFDGCRIGRGAPINADVLRDAGISEIWVERLSSLIQEQHGDAAQLLFQLERREDERTRGFQTRIRERLKEFLLDRGFFDDREPLDEPALQARVRVAVADHIDQGILDADDVAARVHELYHQGGIYV
jgi:uncharacterized protein YhaN